MNVTRHYHPLSPLGVCAGLQPTFIFHPGALRLRDLSGPPAVTFPLICRSRSCDPLARRLLHDAEEALAAADRRPLGRAVVARWRTSGQSWHGEWRRPLCGVASRLAPNAATSSEQGADVAEQIFVRWNQNGDAILDMAEVGNMLEACAFEIDAQYIDGLADLFGTFDQDDSGVINAYNLGQFILNMICLPRQARDKHRESTHTKEGDHFRRHRAARISADV
jgi:hypothetical protein